MENMTTEDYKKAKQLLKDHKVCGNGVHGCNQVFKTEDVTRTTQYGQTYYWCSACYESIIKNDKD